MKMCIASFKSMTNAIKGKRALEGKNIPCSVVNLDPSITKHGCAYGISFSCDYTKTVKEIFDMRGIPYGEILGYR